MIRLAGAVADLLMLFWPVTLLVGGVWVAAAFRSAREPGAGSGQLTRWCLLPALPPVAILLIAAAFDGRGGAQISPLPESLLGGLFVAPLLIGVALARRAGGRSPVVVASAVAWCWVSACAALVGWMSLTDSWL